MDSSPSSSQEEIVHLNIWNPSPEDIEFDRTKNAQHLLTFLNQGCPPTILGTIYPAPSPLYLHALKVGIENPAAFLNDTNVIALTKWRLDRIVEASLVQDGTVLGEQTESDIYKTEYHRRIKALQDVQSKVSDDYEKIAERLRTWKMMDSDNIRLQKSAVQQREETRIEFVKAEIEKIEAERRESLEVPGLAWLLDLTEDGDLAMPEQRKRYYRGRKGIPVQRVGALAFEPQEDSTLQAEHAVQALKAISRTDNRSRATSPHTMSAAETLLQVSAFESKTQETHTVASDPTVEDASLQPDSSNDVPETISEDESIIVVSSCERRRNKYAPELIPEDQDGCYQSATLSDASGSLYADNSHDSNDDDVLSKIKDQTASKCHTRRIATATKRIASRNEAIPTPPLSSPAPEFSQSIAHPRNAIIATSSAKAPLGRTRSISPVFHPTKTISQSTINTLEADYPFLSSITPLKLRYDYCHFLSCFGNTPIPPPAYSSNNFFASAPTLVLTHPPTIPITTRTNKSTSLVHSNNNMMQLQPSEPSKTLKTELNAWFFKNGRAGIKKADKFLKCLWDACGEILPIQGSEEKYGEMRVGWKG